ncbi:SDR family oxidoreductase [Streptosporangium sp. NPDC002721]|uniref:SDR family oxidoreductase n=1 Tax=Streptosporangium sp. NPDC002721 TaxID=3366188 RepID=UPI003681263D
MREVRAASLILAREGAKVVGYGIQADADNEPIGLVGRDGGEMTRIAPVDLTDPEQARQVVEDAAPACGGLDVVCEQRGHATFCFDGRFLGLPADDWRVTMAGELDVPFFASKLAWPTRLGAGAASSSTSRPCPA